MSRLATCLSLKGHPLIEMKEVQLPRNTLSPSEIKTFRCSVKQLLLHYWTWLTSGLLTDWPSDFLKTRRKKGNCSIKMHMATDWAKILFTSKHSYKIFSDTNKLCCLFTFSLSLLFRQLSEHERLFNTAKWNKGSNFYLDDYASGTGK